MRYNCCSCSYQDTFLDYELMATYRMWLLLVSLTDDGFGRFELPCV